MMCFKNLIDSIDPRTRDWFLLWNNPIPVLCLCAAYILFVILGKKYMANRKAMQVPPVVLFFYNMSLVLLSVYMFEEVTTDL